jgi:alpha-ketoglutarate-dependent taurine dioxygenase
MDSVFKSREPTGAGCKDAAKVKPSDDNHEKEHPLVWTHRSGRKSLVIGVSADRIVGRPLAEGRALLSRLLEWSVQPDFIYRHQWQEGDLVVCNNPGALHRVIPYEINSGRAMHRTTVAGVELVQ